MPFAGDLHYRDVGQGEPPVVVLHGGWGYAFYPFDDAIAGIARRFVIPDRTGYGRSPPLGGPLSIDFHAWYANETLALLDQIGIERCVFWGHSDGAVIAAILGIRAPDRCAGVILEAIHLERVKPRSRPFFERMAHDPDSFGERVTSKLHAEHGAHWRDIIKADGQAWLDIAATPELDVFDHRLHELRVPVLVPHGTEDPRTEPGELDRIRREVPHARLHMIEGGHHAPHAEPKTASTCTQIVRDWLAVLPSQ